MKSPLIDFYARVIHPLRAFLCSLILTAGAIAQDGDPSVPGHSLHGESFNEGPRQQAYLMGNTGDIDFPVTTSSEEAQAFFNQGVGQLHGFWYFEAERSFRQVRFLDPDCVMALWGLAMANVNNEERASDFMKEAADYLESGHLTKREQLYLKSLYQLYHGNEKDDKKRYAQLVSDLEKIARAYPDDIEAKAFLVCQTWQNTRKGIPMSSHLAFDALAKQVLDVQPLHPVHHYRIHLWDYEEHAQALSSAARCGQSAPGIAHMWHMPGHTYSGLHRYHDAAWQQEASARVDHAQMMRDRVLPDQIHNYAHNNGWLVESFAFVGEVERGIALAKNMIELPRLAKFRKLGDRELFDAGRTSFQEGRSRLWTLLCDYEMWDDLIELSDSMYLEPTEDPSMRNEHFLYRSMAFFSKGESERGNESLAQLKAQVNDLKAERESFVVAAQDAARDDGKNDEDIEKAGKRAARPFERMVKDGERAIERAELYQAVYTERPGVGRERLEKIENLPELEKAALYAELSNWEKALELIDVQIRGKRHPVVLHARRVDLLNRLGRTEEAKATMEELRKLASTADLNSPPLARLADFASSLELPVDWRIPLKPSDDLIERPDLADLGTLYWTPPTAPSWSLPDSEGKEMTLRDFEGRNVLVIFYLGKGCVHCMEQLNAFAPMVEEYREAGIEVVAVSLDTVDGLKDTFAKAGETGESPFPFPLLSDFSKETFKSYRAYDEFEDLALHGTYLIDSKGRIRWQDISYEPFMHASWLLKESQRLLESEANTRPQSEVSAVR